MKQPIKETYSNYVIIPDSIALRLKEFSYVTAQNPNKLAWIILNQWMDNQMEMYGEKWGITGRKGRIMRGSKPRNI